MSNLAAPATEIREKHQLTTKALSIVTDEAKKANITLEQALTESVGNNWVSFKVLWYKNSNHPLQKPFGKERLPKVERSARSRHA